MQDTQGVHTFATAHASKLNVEEAMRCGLVWSFLSVGLAHRAALAECNHKLHPNGNPFECGP